ncbi:peptide ABC transporter permease [Sphaerisporangium krabiense]|uniref:Peptide/nickel transport system permease protein n=1 Tax=Sphaerisporangium krabiense TaxID=763782 RepID=A0A7W8ZB26_9ACTN|nr:ABC transporter permease [Sphaerisporangium krabiense]MBB5630656.1 peptide/nickel transport system permease protein [Sphaerisporangium krabiense]GII62388.1 peptide ABC transporter permease [Sphaerisporangium krabiense]
MTSVTAPAAARPPGHAAAGRSPSRLVWDRVRRDRTAMTGLVIIAVFVLVAVTAPLLTALNGWSPYEFDASAVDQRLAGVPKGALGGVGAEHWLGVEPVSGRDVFSRIVYGARISLLISVLATVVSVLIGTVLGLLAGYLGGWADAAVSRLMDLLMSFPALIFMIALISVMPEGDRVLLLVAVMGGFGWPYVGRIVRGQAMAVRHREYVDAARVGGAMGASILFREMLPNITAPILVYATLAIPANIGTEAALSFLGVGVRPPTASWGQMIQESMMWYEVDPMYFIVPGACLFLTVLAFTLLGDSLRDAIDPKGGRA